MNIIKYNRNFRNHIIRSLVLAAILLLVFSCRKEDFPPGGMAERGDIISERVIDSWDTSTIHTLVNALAVELPIPLQSGVTVYSITYYTLNPKGDLVPATGALFIPEVDDAMPVMSIQHGTETKKSMVSSVNPLITTGEGMVGLVTGSLGYITCIPDYLGLGGSSGLHPYLHAATLSANVVDFLVAARESLQEKSVATTGELYLTGYSEGGYVTMAAHRELQNHYPAEFPVTASVPMAGPYDLKGTIDTVLSRPGYPNPAFIAYFLLAYNQIYRWNRLGDIFKSPYETLVPQLFDGNHTSGQIADALPNTLSELIQDDFIAGYLDGSDQELMEAVKENTLLGWAPLAPVLMIHGTEDEIVPYQNMITARDDMLKNGAAHVETREIPGGSHGSSALPAFTRMLMWVDSLHQLQY
ncbi:MAG: alpha/beta hydrolase [Chlorobi bacterium]|nr:alpha/beta hydrolase [Chlorobiota bacterium]